MHERVTRIISIALVLLSFAGECKNSAIDSPAGPVYIGRSEEIPRVKAHELCHDELRRTMGNQEYYKYYLENPCREEMRCRQPGEPIHPFCKDRY